NRSSTRPGKGTAMKLSYVHQPVQDLKAALTFYRERLGFEEAWREGDSTAALKLPGTEVQLLVDEDPNEEKAGPTFTVESVDAFYQEHKGKIHFLFEPRDIPPGRYSAFADPSGNVIRLIDLTREQEH